MLVRPLRSTINSFFSARAVRVGVWRGQSVARSLLGLRSALVTVNILANWILKIPASPLKTVSQLLLGIWHGHVPRENTEKCAGGRQAVCVR